MRTQGLTTDGRVIDIYSKSGSLPPYNGMLALIPDFGVTIALLMGGPESSPAGTSNAGGQLAKMFIPALDKASKEEAMVNFVGTYTDEENDSTITLSVDYGPGLLVTDMVMRSFDVLGNFGMLVGVQGDLEVTLRLYATGLQADGQLRFGGIFDVGPVGATEEVDNLLPFIADVPCMTYVAFEGATYGMNSIDDFVISVWDDGHAESVESRFWRVKMGVSEREVSKTRARVELK